MPSSELHVTRIGKGPRIVLVHGFTQSSASWKGIAEALSDDFLVLSPDVPGHGASPIAVGDISRAADSLGQSCAKGTYVGYSAGGRMCLHLALRRPILVDRLVLVSTTAGIEDVEDRAARRHDDDALAYRIASGGDAGVPSFVEEWLATPLFKHLSADQADRPSRLVNTAAGLASSLRNHGTGTQLPMWEQVRALEMPVLVVAGERDAKFVALGERLAAAIGENAMFLLVPGAGHAVPFEQPDAFATLVKSFATGALWR